MQHWRGVVPKGVMIDVEDEELVDEFARQARALKALNTGMPSKVHDRKHAPA
jgi:hypothetical protein